MLDFMVIGLPRSGLAWAANWLTTDSTYCALDPSLGPDEWDRRLPRVGVSGVASTRIWTQPAWVNAHPARKLILLRDQDTDLSTLDGVQADVADLFDPYCARELWGYLTGLTFNAKRHSLLCEFSVYWRNS